MIQQTSILAYKRAQRKTAPAQRNRVLCFFRANPGATNAECAFALGIPASTVSARRSEIKNRLISTGQRKCSITGATAKTWRVI